MSSALQGLYTGAAMSVKVAGAQFASNAGVRQGCPVSPTLFGLFLDDLHRYLHNICPNNGPCLQCGMLVPILMYADDITLLATSTVHLTFKPLYKPLIHSVQWLAFAFLLKDRAG